MWILNKIKRSFTLFKESFNLNKALEKAVDKGDQDSAVDIIARMHENNIAVIKASNLMHIAAFKNQVKVVKEMLQIGVDVNKMDANKSIPLEFAISGEAYDCAKLLLENNSDLRHNNAMGHNPIMCCNTQKMAKLLVEYGDNPLSKNLCHNTGLLVACNRGNAEMVEFFLEQGAIKQVYQCGPDSDSAPGRPPIMCAATPEVLELLLKHGADLNKYTDKAIGKTALEFYSEMESYQEIIQQYSSSDYNDLSGNDNELLAN